MDKHVLLMQAVQHESAHRVASGIITAFGDLSFQKQVRIIEHRFRRNKVLYK